MSLMSGAFKITLQIQDITIAAYLRSSLCDAFGFVIPCRWQI